MGPQMQTAEADLCVDEEQPPAFLTAAWTRLVMLNYPVEPALLCPHVPPGTELDLYDGDAYVSVVGLCFEDTRLLGIRVPLHRDFPEVNLRFYVRRRVDGGWRRGVVFVKELVPKLAVAAVARWVYNENYVSLPLRVVSECTETIQDITYSWKHQGRWEALRARAMGPARLLSIGTAEEFIAEHYYGYSVQPDGRTLEYRVDHTPWRVWLAGHALLEADVDALYGRALGEYLRGAPSSAFIAEGSPVVVRKGVPLDL